MNYDNYHLFAQPSFSEGMARILDIGNNENIYNYSPTNAAIYSDWLAIGGDLQGVIGNGRKSKRKHNKPKKQS